ncbi:oligopeptide/dipeptide ABC transporter ATP-binding protein [Aequitasia blattaphilus]|uniref:ABC transporter ATP-binding protein n=2 Tax=Lachnospiraceae TaxID=186803 RepID=A0ABT1EL03_9FIRM|nr:MULTISPECIES: ABC transporter ATP-binding protein [Lachnospiraceae]MCP1101025.1 ABC transporter ATP-binding protein [Aequitasia blattaphilus]MCP1111390.1 ABC transporter ATP-binding protein [Ohessyouella blattaphilus]MCR8564784.1 ABC transporter ATP-binding protein [Ohessyouella blattaphilus]MCR8613665.1 ABC transporter ATP-binding protein [Aequitasia blattaphilus]
MVKKESKHNFFSVRDLRVEYASGQEVIHAVNGVSFELESGTTIGLVGETGAGKTSIARAIMRILPDYATKSVSGKVDFKAEELLELPESEMRLLRGKSISMIFQDPMTALNPVKKVVDQIAEGVRLHQNTSKRESIEIAIKMLEMVGISEDRAYEYPHQFSGGMKQRVVIAIALACNPEILIADEPTTALDVTIQAQVLELMKELKEKLGTAMILITHDLGVVAEVCDTVAVVYAGELVEYGTKERVFDKPSHPYTQGLFNALPDLSKNVKRLTPIEGLPPDPSNLPKGCAFASRCPFVTEECKKDKIDMIKISENHQVRCIRCEEE